MSKTTNKFFPEVYERAVRMVQDSADQHGSRWKAITSIAATIPTLALSALTACAAAAPSADGLRLAPPDAALTAPCSGPRPDPGGYWRGDAGGDLAGRSDHACGLSGQARGAYGMGAGRGRGDEEVAWTQTRHTRSPARLIAGRGFCVYLCPLWLGGSRLHIRPPLNLPVLAWLGRTWRNSPATPYADGKNGYSTNTFWFDLRRSTKRREGDPDTM